MEVRFRETAAADVGRFVASYVEGFFELYSDTGIWSGGIILKSVLSNGDKLFHDLYDGIEVRLSARSVLGRKKLGRNGHECRMYVASRLVIVYYSDDRKTSIRWVESIAIDRKPIIF